MGNPYGCNHLHARITRMQNESEIDRRRDLYSRMQRGEYTPNSEEERQAIIEAVQEAGQFERDQRRVRGWRW